ncbi:MAG: hypothetical protein K2G60_06505 [Oscillospiraceae bacterium]|nr:hypothetical protein [Oscillospiraceae bacterium]
MYDGRIKISIVGYADLGIPQCVERICVVMAIYTKDADLWGTPGEGSPPKNSPQDCFSPLLRFGYKEILQSADCKVGLFPSTPSPFEKGGRKLFCYVAIIK